MVFNYDCTVKGRIMNIDSIEKYRCYCKILNCSKKHTKSGTPGLSYHLKNGQNMDDEQKNFDFKSP